MAPTIEEELALLDAGHARIAGIDEAGRGCWAGPVVAAAVLLDRASLAAVAALGVDDSKALSARQRAALAAQVRASALGWGVGVVPAFVIDTHGILPATRAAMQIAVLQLPQLPQALLIDAVRLEGWPCPQRALVRGDARCAAIAAASIIAKVARDTLLDALDAHLPAYGFGEHKGYGTALHERALRAHGPSPHHRRTFRPIATFLQDGAWPASARLTSGRMGAHIHEEGDHDA